MMTTQLIHHYSNFAMPLVTTLISHGLQMAICSNYDSDLDLNPPRDVLLHFSHMSGDNRSDIASSPPRRGRGRGLWPSPTRRGRGHGLTSTEPIPTTVIDIPPGRGRG